MNLYHFGANDERGHLIELNIPAETESEAKDRLTLLVGQKGSPCYNRFWLNDVTSYD